MFLRQRWFFNFLPQGNINKYQVFAYKVRVFEPGSNSITFQRLYDQKSRKLTPQQAKDNLLNAMEYVKFAKANGFVCVAADDTRLVFCKRK